MLYISNISCTWVITRNRDPKIHRLKTCTSSAFLCVSDIYKKNFHAKAGLILWPHGFQAETLPLRQRSLAKQKTCRSYIWILIYFDIVILSNIFSLLQFYYVYIAFRNHHFVNFFVKMYWNLFYTRTTILFKYH